MSRFSSARSSFLALALVVSGCAAATPSERDPSPPGPDARVAQVTRDARPSQTSGDVPLAITPVGVDASSPSVADASAAPDVVVSPDLLAPPPPPPAPDAAPAGPASIGFELVWIRMADTEGQMDKDPTTESAESAAFSPDGTLIAAGSKGVLRDGLRRGQRVTLWRVSDGSLVWQRPRANEVEAVQFSPDGRFIAAGGEDQITEILDARDGRVIRTLRTDASIDGLRFSNDGQLLAVGTEAQRILLYSTADGRLLSSTNHGGSGTNAVNQIDFTSDDKRLVSAGTNAQVKVWTVQRTIQQGVTTAASLTLVRTLAHKATVKSVRISSDDRLMASGGGHGGGTLVHELATGRQVAHIPGTAWTMETVEFTPDGRFLLTGGSEGNGRGTAEQHALFPPNGGFGKIRVYRVPERLGDPFELVTAQPSFRQEYYDFTKDGRLMVSSHEDGTIRLWSVVPR